MWPPPKSGCNVPRHRFDTTPYQLRVAATAGHLDIGNGTLPAIVTTGRPETGSVRAPVMRSRVLSGSSAMDAGFTRRGAGIATATESPMAAIRPRTAGTDPGTATATVS